MSSLNKATLIGRLGKDPELRYTKNQTPFAKFSLATSETFTTNGERREKTEWHNLVVWGKLAEIAGRYLKKGKQIYAEGRIEYREFEGQDGQRRFFTDIRVDRFVMLGSARDSGGYGEPMEDYGSRPQAGGGSGAPAQGGYGGPQAGGQAPPQGMDSGPPPEPAGYASHQGGAPKAAEPTNYGTPVPQNDEFNDDDIPF